MKPKSIITAALATFLAAQTTPLAAQAIVGSSLTLSLAIDQNGFGNNYFSAFNSIFSGRACIGGGCNGNEPFAQDPLRLKWTEPGLLFEDSSTTGGFSSNDWRLVINDGAVSKFAVQDIDGGAIPFTIEGGAPANALYVNDIGRIGVGTTLPGEELHISASSPNIRLEDDTGTPYIWDIGGHNGAFFVRDVTSFSDPFVIRAGAPNSSFEMAANGNVGLGTASAAAPLHIRRDDNTASLLIEETGAGTLGQMTLRNNGITFFTLEDTSIAAGDNTGRSWNFQNQAGTFRVTTAPGGAANIEMLLTPQGDMTIKGELTTAGSCSVGCDRVFDADYPLPTIAEHNAEMWANGHLPNVGPTAEDGPFNVSDKMGRMLNELEHAHIFIGQQQSQLEAQNARIAALESKLDDLLSK